MNKKIKLAVVMLGVSLLLASCKSQKEVLDAVEKDSIIMGLDDTFAPMGFRDEKNVLVGFDIDLANAVSEKLGKEIIFQPIDWSMKETELKSGNIDFIWNGYSITEERKEKVEFSKPYLENKQIIVVLSDSDIISKEDLKDKKVGVQNGSSTLKAINQEPEIVETFENQEPVLFDTNHEALMDLEAGRLDAVVSDEVLSRYYISGKNPDDYRILDDDFGEEEYAIGLRKEDKKTLEALNKALEEIELDGTYNKIYDKWFAK